MRNRNQNISPGYIDNVLGGQVRLLSLSASVFDDTYLRLSSSFITVGYTEINKFRILDTETNQAFSLSSSEGMMRIGIGGSGTLRTHFIQMSGVGQPIGIAQGYLGGTNTFEFTTADVSGNQSTRLMFRGGTDDADFEVYGGASGSNRLQFFIDGVNGATQIGTGSSGIPFGLLDVRSGDGPLSASFFKSSPTVSDRGGIVHHQDSVYAFQQASVGTGTAAAAQLRLHLVDRATLTISTGSLFVVEGDGRIGVNTDPTPTATFRSYFSVIPRFPTGSVAHFVTGVGTTPVTIGRSTNTGSEVLSISTEDAAHNFDAINDESSIQMLFSITSGSTGGGTGVKTTILRLIADGGPVSSTRVGINRSAVAQSLEVQGDTLTTGDFTGSGGFRNMVNGMWISQNIPATSKAVMGQPNALAVDTRVVMPFPGSIIGISAREYNGAAAAGSPITFSASINGTANATIKVDVGIGAVQNSAQFAKDAVTFAAGDALGIFRATGAAWTSTTNDYNAWLIVEF